MKQIINPLSNSQSRGTAGHVSTGGALSLHAWSACLGRCQLPSWSGRGAPSTDANWVDDDACLIDGFNSCIHTYRKDGYAYVPNSNKTDRIINPLSPRCTLQLMHLNDPNKKTKLSKPYTAAPESRQHAVASINKSHQLLVHACMLSIFSVYSDELDRNDGG